MNFQFNGGLTKPDAKGTTAQCFPLYTLLKAVGVDTIDYYSLDIEGQEMPVLKTIPWDKVKINVFTIEYRAIPYTPDGGKVSEQRLQMFRDYFKSLKVYKEIQIIDTLDIVFARTDLQL